MRFLLLDRITSFYPGVKGTAIKNVALSEDFFEDHFPLKPIMPGVLMLEGMAQLSGLLLEEGVRKETGKSVKALMSIVESAKFRKPVHPGDTLEYLAEVLSTNELGGRISASAKVDGILVCECKLMFSFHKFEHHRLEERRSRILSQWLEGTSNNAEIG